MNIISLIEEWTHYIRKTAANTRRNYKLSYTTEDWMQILFLALIDANTRGKFEIEEPKPMIKFVLKCAIVAELQKAYPAAAVRKRRMREKRWSQKNEEKFRISSKFIYENGCEFNPSIHASPLTPNEERLVGLIDLRRGLSAIKNKRNKQILNRRLEGETVISIGKDVGLTKDGILYVQECCYTAITKRLGLCAAR